MRYPCYFLEESGTTRLYLRRFLSSENPCPKYGYHNAMTVLMDVPTEKVITGDDERWHYGTYSQHKPATVDTRWPTRCEHCQYEFLEAGDYQLFPSNLYRRTDTGELITLSDASPGALWYATWMKPYGDMWKGPDGEVLYCKTPGGDWNIDSRASNCTMPQDNTHRCWVRHGDARDPLGLKSGKPLHVDKGGHTCQAGAGSIQCNSYHGFLHAGHLTEG